jgi:hypothetical protein
VATIAPAAKRSKALSERPAFTDAGVLDARLQFAKIITITPNNETSAYFRINFVGGVVFCHE